MRYPMTSNWLSYRRISRDKYHVTDSVNGFECTMGCELALFARRLDGRTNPYRISPAFSKHDVDLMLAELRSYDLLRSKRVLHSSFGTFLYTVWIPRWTAALRTFASRMNSLLLFLWLPVLVLGITFFIQTDTLFNTGFSFVYCLFGSALGICLHELAHAFAGVSYRARVSELGIGFQNFMFCAYTLLDCSNCQRLHKVQIHAAGIEMNLLLTGFFLMLCAVFPHYNTIFFSAAIGNVLFVPVNLLCLEGLDGMAILSEVIGTNESIFLEKTREVALSWSKQKNLRKKGLSGHLLILMSYIITIAQVGFPLLMLLNIGAVVSWFI